MASFSQAYSNMTMSTCLIFPPKTARDPHQRDMVAYFWTAPTAWFQGGTEPNSRGFTLPLSDFLLVLWPSTGTGHLLENHSQGPLRQTTLFSAILHGTRDRADDAQTLLQIWLTFYSMNFEKTGWKFGSTTLSGGFCANRGASDTSGITSKLKLLWLGSEHVNFRGPRLFTHNCNVARRK